jgi:hypothetical protein
VTTLQSSDGAIVDTYQVEDGPTGVTFAGESEETETRGST